MNDNKTFSLLFSFVVISLFIYLYGFFPVEYSSHEGTKRSNERGKSFGCKYIDKLAIIIVDALRYDFVIPQSQENFMPYTMSSILSNQSCLIITKAHSPTVTMPRIKAITSGTVSNYIDVALNLMSTDFKEDNFISTAKSHNLKVVFYGDDTWLKLFPDSFLRSEGTNSFYALDYSEVDHNVTRHVDKEFNKSDWDIIILHYLGLDHIGHTEGPNSLLIKPKLQEMDNVIKKFSTHFKHLENKGLKTMIIVTSDHGMKDSGGHGGMTYSEITLPLISVDHSCEILPGWPNNHVTMQIDIAPTLSTLFGLPIPTNNMGKIIPALLHNLKYENILKALEINRVQLSHLKRFFKKDFEKYEPEPKLFNWLLSGNKNETVLNKVVMKYFKLLNHISQEMVKSNSGFKMFYLILGVIFIWIFFTIFLHQFLTQFPKPQNLIHWLLVLGTISHAFSCISSSFIEEEHQVWYFFWSTFCIFSFLKTKKLDHNVFKFQWSWIFIAVIHRFLKKLNQTGNKWANLPDIKSYLSVEGHVWLFPFFLLGTGMVFCCIICQRCPRRQKVVFGVCLLAIIIFKISNGTFRAKYLTFYPRSSGKSEVLLFWVTFSIFFFQTAFHKTPHHLVWLLLASFLLRPHNIILISIEVFISKQIHKMFHKREDFVWNNIAHVWLGNLFYFYQGNGNSLANIDVASGFVGIQTYNPIYAGIMMEAHTLNGHILSFLLSSRSNLVYALIKIISLAVYCTSLFFQLHHLFIWSVFSPKLLFETNTTLLVFIFIIFNSFFSK